MIYFFYFPRALFCYPILLISYKPVSYFFFWSSWAFKKFSLGVFFLILQYTASCLVVSCRRVQQLVCVVKRIITCFLKPVNCLSPPNSYPGKSQIADLSSSFSGYLWFYKPLSHLPYPLFPRAKIWELFVFPYLEAFLYLWSSSLPFLWSERSFPLHNMKAQSVRQKVH